MELRKRVLTLTIVLVCPLFGGLRITGIVTNLHTGQSIPGVNIYVKSLGIGTSTDENGNFILKSSGEVTDLLVSFDHVSYKKVIVPVNKSGSLNIKMEDVLIKLDELVVTGTRSPYLLRNVPVSTELITRKDIEDSGAITASELLEQRAGVTIDTNVDGGYVFKLLGLDSRYILILRDGQPVTGRFNNRVDLNQISLNNVEKIEITKGPGSAMYGSEAMGGVINIISSNNSNSLLYNLKFRNTTYSNSINNINKSPFGTALSFSTSLPIKSFYITTSLTGQLMNRGKDFEYIDSDEVKKLNFDGKLKWTTFNKRHTVGFNYNYFVHNDSGSTNLSTGLLLFSNATKIHRNSYGVWHSWLVFDDLEIKHSLILNSYQRKYLQKNVDGYLEKEDLTEENSNEYELLFSKPIGKIKLNGGLEFSKPSYKSDRIESGLQTKWINSIFLQQDYMISNIYSIVAGFRLDQYGKQNVVSPRLALLYSPIGNLKYRFSYGHGFRAPSFMERLIDWNHYQFNYQVIGNPDLKPEKSRGFTAGLEYVGKGDFKLSALIYQNRFFNMIDDYVVETGKLSYKNITKAKFNGFELIADYIINSQLFSSMVINYVNNIDGNGDGIPNTVPLSAGLRINFIPSSKGIEFSTNTKAVFKATTQEYDPIKGDYIAGGQLDPYGLIDIQIKYILNKRYQLTIGSKNITNHTNESFGPFIGRTGYVEFSIK